MSYLDDKFGPGTWRRSTDPKLPQRRTVRVEDGGAGAVYDDPDAKESVLDLTKISGGGAGSGHDTGAHVGGGQDVLSASGTDGVFPIRDGVATAFGQTNVAATGTARMRNDFTAYMARPVFDDGAIKWFSASPYNDGIQFGPDNVGIRVSTVNSHLWEFGDWSSGSYVGFSIDNTLKRTMTATGHWFGVGQLDTAGDDASNVFALMPGSDAPDPSTGAYIYNALGALNLRHISGAMVVKDGTSGEVGGIFIGSTTGRRVPAGLHVDVADYGATGNIGDDQTAAIQAALDAVQASGSPAALFFPAKLPGPAIYSITHPLRIYTSFVALRGALPNMQTIRGSFGGPIAIVAPTIDLTLYGKTTAIVPPHAGNPAGFSWDISLNGYEHVPLWYSQEWQLNGKGKITVELFYKHTAGVTGSGLFSILDVSGRYPDDPGLSSALSLRMLGSAQGYGADNTCAASLNLNGSLLTFNGGVLTVGTTYHLALCFDNAVGTVQFYVTPITTGTLNLAASSAGHSSATITQAAEAIATLGACVSSPRVIFLHGAPGTVDGVRLSDINRYPSGGSTPTTKWDRTPGSDPNARFILNFDEFFATDVMVASVGGNAVKHYFGPPNGNIVTDAIDDVLIENLAFDNGDAAPDQTSGIYALLAAGLVLRDVGGANNLPVYTASCLYGVRQRVRATTGGQYGILDVNGTETYYDTCAILAGYTARFWIYGDGVQHFHKCGSLDAGGTVGPSIVFAGGSHVDVDVWLTDEEANAARNGPADVVVGSTAQVTFRSCIFDSTYQGSSPLHGLPVVAIGDATVRFEKCLLVGSSVVDTANPTPEFVTYRAALTSASTPTIVEGCQFLDQATGVKTTYGTAAIPVTLTPQYLTVRSGARYEQSAGSMRWLSVRANSTQRTAAYQAGAHTTTATTTNATFDDIGDGTSGSVVPLTDGADTRVDVVIVMRGSTWSWTQSQRLTFRRSGATVTTSTNGSADPSPDTIGTAPAVSAALVSSGTGWAVALTTTATTIDSVVSATATEVSVP